MTAALDAVLERLARDGPTDVFISEADYPLLRDEARRLWSQRSRAWGRDARSACLFLAFLRGYTFYQPLHDNERQFWPHFYEELDLPFSGSVGSEQRNALWDVLEGHPLTRPHCRYTFGIERDRREFVRAIDEIWGIRSLSAARVVTVFTAYHLHHAGETVTPELLRRFLPDIDDLALRQVRSYDCVFQTLSRVVDFLLDTGLSLAGLSSQALAAQLTAGGLDLGQPNVVHFLASKSPVALAEIIAVLSRTPRRRFALLVKAAPQRPVQATDPHRDVQIQLAPGVYEVGSSIPLSLIDRASDMAGNVRVLIAGHSFQPRRGEVILQGLPEGRHRLEIELDGQTTGVTASIQVVPRLQWTPRQRGGRLFQGQWEVGRVCAADGRFALFPWRPDRGDAPAGSHLTVDLGDDLLVDFTVTGDCIGASLIDVRDGQAVKSVDNADLVRFLAVKPLLPADLARRPAYRVFLESHTAQKILAAPEGLKALITLPSTPGDRLIVEAAWDGDWQRVLTVPYDLSAQLTSVVPSATSVDLDGYAHAGSTLSVEESGAWSGEVRCTRHQVAGQFQLRRALRLSQVLEERQVVVTLTSPGVPAVVSTVLLSPADFPLSDWVGAGLALGQLLPAVINRA